MLASLTVPNPLAERCGTSRHGVTPIALDEAFNSKWLEMYYQPVVDLRTGEISAAEGLIRAQHPDLGVLGPAQLLPGASDEALWCLTEFVILAALHDWTSFNEAGLPIRLSVNAPASALLHVPIAEIVREHRPQSPSWPGLIVEVTEDAPLPSTPLHGVAAQLRMEQIELSLDDFGQGFSNLARLRALPFQSLKIDRSLVSGCGSDATQTDVVRGIVDMAHHFGCRVVAEGVESTTQLKCLNAMGCDYAQGHLLGYPMPTAEFIRVCA